METLPTENQSDAPRQAESLVGKRFLNLKARGLEARVMAETEGYILARHKGCVPFVKSRKEFLTQFQLIENGQGIGSFACPKSEQSTTASY